MTPYDKDCDILGSKLGPLLMKTSFCYCWCLPADMSELLQMPAASAIRRRSMMMSKLPSCGVCKLEG